MRHRCESSSRGYIGEYSFSNHSPTIVENIGLIIHRRIHSTHPPTSQRISDSSTIVANIGLIIHRRTRPLTYHHRRKHRAHLPSPTTIVDSSHCGKRRHHYNNMRWIGLFVLLLSLCFQFMPVAAVNWRKNAIYYVTGDEAQALIRECKSFFVLRSCFVLFIVAYYICHRLQYIKILSNV